MGIMINSTPTALWHGMVHQAEQACSVTLKEDLESYLVFLLMRYIDKPGFVKEIIGTAFLQSLTLDNLNQEVALQAVGDKCLLFAGLFPNIAEKRLVRISYFVNIGQAAYFKISRKNNDLYDGLSHQFVSLMDILQSMRQCSQQYPDLLPLQAYELWNDTGSKRALAILKQYTHDSNAMPLPMDVKDSWLK